MQLDQTQARQAMIAEIQAKARALRIAAHSTIDPDDNDTAVDSSVAARLKPRPTLNSGAIALPLPEDHADEPAALSLLAAAR